MIGREQAIAIASERAARNGWPLVAPVYAFLRRPWVGTGGSWEVRSDPRMRGAKTRFKVDAITGEILEQGHIPR